MGLQLNRNLIEPTIVHYMSGKSKEAPKPLTWDSPLLGRRASTEGVGDVFDSPRRLQLYMDNVALFSDRARAITNRNIADYVTGDTTKRKVIGEKIRAARKAIGWGRQYQLAQAASVSTETVSRIENGGNVEMETFRKVYTAVFPGVGSPIEVLIREDKDWFIQTLDGLDTGAVLSDKHRQDEIDIVQLDSPHTKQSLPVLYEGDASPDGLLWTDQGTPRFQVEEWGSRPDDVTDPQAYIVVIRGDSMEPAYRKGWRAIVSPNLPIFDGDIVCVHLMSGERLIKYAHRERSQQGWMLQSHNQAYAPRFAADSDVTTIHKVAYIRTMK